jgi:Fe-S cluster biogenesis protein NfuA
MSQAPGSSSAKIAIRSEFTPNPQTMRFSISGVGPLVESPIEFKSVKETGLSPLAKKLFGFPWTAGVYIGADFVTVTKQDWVDWETLAEPLAGLLGEHFERGEIAVVKSSAVGPRPSSADPNDTPVVAQIKDILNREIRPAVALDGGDITFHSFQDGVVSLILQGSCAGCPSSTMTLKQGIETRLRAAIPEVREVVSVN